MKFLVDNQLPQALARHLTHLGHEAHHVSEIGMDEATDQRVWAWADDHACVVVSKDEDFFFLANRQKDEGRLLWIRLGNCRKTVLLHAIDRTLGNILAAFDSGQRVVELT